MLRMSEKSWWRRIVPLLCGLMLALALVGCSHYENPAKIPFASDECAGMSYSDVLSQLEEAGFTNVQTTQTETTNKDEDGQVISVTINGESDYKASSTWEGTAPVEINRFVLKQFAVTTDVSVSGDAGEPVFDITTNLPDGAKLVLTLRNNDGYSEEQTVKISDGRASSDPFRNRYNPLLGDFSLSITIKPIVQSRGVQNIIGKDGECLTGNITKQDDGKDTLYNLKTFEYISDYKEPEKISDDEMTALLEQALTHAFGDDYELGADDAGYTVNVQQDGLAMIAGLAKAGYASATSEWESVVESTQQASLSLQLLLDQNGQGDKMVVINVMNDQSPEYALLTVWMASVLYNCVE